MAGIRERLSYANIMATLAVVVAVVGGGIAIAGNKGSKPQGAFKPTVQQASAVPTSDKDAKLLTIPGLGKFTTGCDSSGRTSVTFTSASKTKLTSAASLDSVDFESGDSFSNYRIDELQKGDQAFYSAGFNSLTARVAFFPTNHNQSRPQADVTLGITRACNGATVLATSTEK